MYDDYSEEGHGTFIVYPFFIVVGADPRANVMATSSAYPSRFYTLSQHLPNLVATQMLIATVAALITTTTAPSPTTNLSSKLFLN